MRIASGSGGPVCLQRRDRRLHVCCQDGRINIWMSRSCSHFQTICRWKTGEELIDANMVPLRLVAFGLLAAAWYFTRAADGEVIYACLNETAEISCDVGAKIKLDHILYKVGVGTRCGEGKAQPDDGPDTYCSFPWSEMVVEDLCANKRSCKVPVTELVFSKYECVEDTRYLEVSYTCATPPPPPPPPPPPTKADCEEKSTDEA